MSDKLRFCKTKDLSSKTKDVSSRSRAKTQN